LFLRAFVSEERFRAAIPDLTTPRGRIVNIGAGAVVKATGLDIEHQVETTGRQRGRPPCGCEAAHGGAPDHPDIRIIIPDYPV
jgi:hypothetical protein